LSDLPLLSSHDGTLLFAAGCTDNPAEHSSRPGLHLVNARNGYEGVSQA
jgi:hypothetical protein